ncbi:MAG: hypothetical protein Q8O79_02770 [Pseudomonadota bacterium]|nr:hypothetical protein [Pseudomonadota bacterium]
MNRLLAMAICDLNGFRGAKQRGTIQQGMNAGIATRDAKQQKTKKGQARNTGALIAKKQCARRREIANQVAMNSTFAWLENNWALTS